MNKTLTIIALLTAATLPLSACGSNESGRTINSNGYNFVEDPNYPFIPTSGPNDCDEEDYINRETDCGFPPGYKTKKTKKKTSSSSKMATTKKSTKSNSSSKTAATKKSSGFSSSKSTSKRK